MKSFQIISSCIFLCTLVTATTPTKTTSSPALKTEWIKVENRTSNPIPITVPTTVSTATSTSSSAFPDTLYNYLSNEQLSDCYYRKTPPNVFKIRCFNTKSSLTQKSPKTELFCLNLTDGFMCI